MCAPVDPLVRRNSRDISAPATFAFVNDGEKEGAKNETDVKNAG